jgi:hypothetical protein
MFFVLLSESPNWKWDYCGVGREIDVLFRE